MGNLRPCSYYESLKRYWRRRKYQRVYGATHGKRRLQVLRLGGGASASPRRFWKIRRIPKPRCKIISPIKLLSQFHDAYVGMIISLTNKMENSNCNGGFSEGQRLQRVDRFHWFLLVKKLIAGWFWKSIRSWLLLDK